jgi:isopentenyl phosphate kinase
MILIKLGGSIITNKEKPLSARRKTIDNILNQIKRIREPKILVHGGGSYGHYWSVKYDMHTKPAKYDMRGVSIVKNSMIDLNKIILDSAVKNRINAYCLPPTDFMNGNKPIKNKILTINEIAKSGLTPVTYGDALWFGQKKSYILSGDAIMSMIGKILKPRLSIFILDVDGVYSNTKSKKLIRDFKKEKPIISKNKIDVTGGMTRKITEATNMSKSGLKVFFVNGNKPKRILDAVSGKKFEGTIFRS